MGSYHLPSLADLFRFSHITLDRVFGLIGGEGK